ncbi:MAG: cytochrome c biogenesis protein ResB [Thermoleophilia bacterium]
MAGERLSQLGRRGQLRIGLRSRDLALGLMAGLTLIVALGSLLPQKLRSDPAVYAEWKVTLPGLVAVLEALGMDDVYSSPVFFGLTGLLALNLGFCTVEQVKRARRRLVRRIDAPRREVVRRQPESVWIPASGNPGHLAGRLAEALRKEGYRVGRVGASSLEARRRWWGYLGLPAFHVALLVIMAGALLATLGRSGGYVELAEGQGFENLPRSYLSYASGPLADSPEGDWAVRLDDFTAGFYDNGQIQTRESRITVFAGEDGPGETHLLSSSHPVEVSGYRVYQTANFGWVALVRLDRPAGQGGDGLVFTRLVEDPEVGRDATGAPPDDLDAALDDPDAALGRVYSARTTPPGTSYSLELEIREDEPGLLVHASLKDGQSEIFSGVVTPGQEVSLPGGETLTFAEMRQWTGLRVTRTPGVELVWVGAAGALLGLLVHYLVVPERLVLFGEEGGYWLGGRRQCYQAAFSERFEVLAARLQNSVETNEERRHVV